MISLTKAQAEIALDKHRFRVLNCGRRFGKTTLAIEEIKGKIAAGKKHICYIAPTYQQARDIAWEALKKELRGADFNESRLEIRIIDCVVVLRGWESIETLRGQAFDFIVIDEAAMMRNFDVNWEEIIRPTLTDTIGKAMFISTPKGFNHFYDLFNKELDDTDYRSFHFTTYDNPNIPVEELEKARKEMTEDRFAQEYLADFKKASGLVYKEFTRDCIYSDEKHNTIEKIAGVDFGYTNPSAILTIDRDSDNNYWVSDEWYRTGKTNIELIEYIKSKGYNAVYPDPAEPDRITEFQNHGINTREVSKDIEAGIDRVRELLKNNKLKVHKSCTNLIWELETYSYPAKKPDKNEPEIPIKENDHCLDALRYALYMNSQSSKITTKQYRF